MTHYLQADCQEPGSVGNRVWATVLPASRKGANVQYRRRRPTVQSLRHALVNRHTRPSAGGVAVPWRTAPTGLPSEVIQHPQLLPSRCRQLIAFSYARHLIYYVRMRYTYELMCKKILLVTARSFCRYREGYGLRKTVFEW